MDGMSQKLEQVQAEVNKVIKGKEDVVKKVLAAVIAGGHILMEDIPGVGKTTLATTFAKSMSMHYKRVQFTPDVLPSDILGFSMYNSATKEFEYREGAVQCNLLLADEINRTSPKTQSALLEAMEERSVTVDGETHPLPNPFICIATQNPVGAAGTQALPESQFDRFMVRLSIGYPSSEDQVNILKAKKYADPLDQIRPLVTAEHICEVQNYLSALRISDELLYYITHLCEATRTNQMVDLGISPRGVLALTQMAKAQAVLKGRSFVVPEDVQDIFIDVCAHRLILKPQARVQGITERSVLEGILKEVYPPASPKRWDHD